MSDTHGGVRQKYRNSGTDSQETIARSWIEILYHRRMEISEWVLFARTSKNLTQLQLGEALSVSKANVSAWEKGRHDPSWAQILKIRQVTGVPLPIDDQQPREPEDSDFAMLRRLDVKASQGKGKLVFSEEERGRLAFRRDFLQKEGVKVEYAVLIYGDGKSMEPTIPDGAILLVDTAQQELRNNKIFVIKLDGEILVKRLRREIGGGVLVVSDNPDKHNYPDILVTPDKEDHISIIGRTFWMGARL
ncbi:LexA family transcriptional regulator [Burkholderia multivorans]|uniref:LexA family transcriptional regulator n=1 Tax=Burkholderia multivorans TaxID=87883 RepID=UPI001481EEF4|nr:LexA family transcriptional regulator [Burkholderia multivorans]